MEYTGLLWATLYGFILWDYLPERRDVLGAAMITLAGGYLVHREALAARNHANHARQAP